MCWFENWPLYTEGKERPKRDRPLQWTSFLLLLATMRHMEFLGFFFFFLSDLHSQITNLLCQTSNLDWDHNLVPGLQRYPQSCCAAGGTPVGGSFNKQGNLLTRFILVGEKTIDLGTHLPEPQAHTEILTGFSLVYCPDALNDTLLSQGCILEVPPSLGTVEVSYIPNIEGRERRFH